MHTLIVDEVETEDEWMSLWGAKERGVRLVVGMQGSLDSPLELDNTDRVFRTAATWRLRGRENLLARCSRALFDSVVELDADKFTTLKVTLDVGKSDASETRRYNSSTNSICVRPAGWS